MRATAQMLAALLLVPLALVPATHPAHASSDDAWAEFRADVEKACRAKLPQGFAVERMRIDPFGSERYGTAVFDGREAGGGGTETLVCVFDKRERAAEIGGPLADAGPLPADDADAAVIEQPEVALPADCPSACRATAAQLSPADVDELELIDRQVAATLADLDHRGLRLDGPAERVRAAFGSGDFGFDPQTVRRGTYRCDVHWYGFLENGAQRVGTHKCRILRAGGHLLFAKTTGERENAGFHPWAAGRTVFVGRTFLEGHAERTYDPTRPENERNPNFGNKVGYAMAADGRIYLVSIDERGMEPKDETFFEILELTPFS